MRIIISYKMFVVNSSVISLEGVGTHMTEVELSHWRVPSPLNILTEGGPGTSCKRRASRAPPPRAFKCRTVGFTGRMFSVKAFDYSFDDPPIFCAKVCCN
eukprot:EG_transcript_14313